MSFLKNIIRNGIRDGVSKGIRDAVGGAVEKAVAPAAEKWANKTAENLNTAAGAVEANTKEVNGAFANLQKAAENYAAAMEKAAKEAGIPTENAVTGAEVPDGMCPFDEFRVYVPEVFPEWRCGGSEHSLFERGVKDGNGREIVSLRCTGTQDNLDRYLNLLRMNGFSQNGDTWEKNADGLTYCLDTTDACEDGSILISYFTK